MSMVYDRFGKALARAALHFKEGDYPQALAVLDESSSKAVVPSEALLLRARLLQLKEVPGDGGDADPLAEVLELLRRACLVAPGDPEPLTELGYFQYAVLDRPEEALAQFQKAAALAEERYVAASVGLAKCLLDLGENDKAHQVARELRNAFPERSFLELGELDLPG